MSWTKTLLCALTSLATEFDSATQTSFVMAGLDFRFGYSLAVEESGEEAGRFV